MSAPSLANDAVFVLLDDPASGGARLYRNPVAILATTRAEEVIPLLEELRGAVRAGRHAAGYLAYEAGLALEPRLLPLLEGHDSSRLLLWFGLFDSVETIAAPDVPALLPDPAGAWTGPPRPLVTQHDHAAMFAEVRDYIAAGDIYQANLTFLAAVEFAGHPLALHARLRASGHGGWGGVVRAGGRWLLSASPELFFTLADGLLTARPMKGTAARAADPGADAEAAARLAHEPKERAENLMIVDLLRNDLTRVAAPGSVAVPALFEVETYPTVHQMTSTVTARLAEGHDAVDVLRTIFPCGSVTGAPKIRAMEIIAEVERSPRDAYTGSIGWIDPQGDAAFNVAIRTLSVNDGDASAVIGLGSGIVADSGAGAEWRECLMKGAFLTAGNPAFDLIETMRFDPVDGIADLDRHLARMKASADRFGFAFDRHDVRNELQAATFRLDGARRIRLRASPTGAVAIEVRAAPAPADEPVGVALVPLPVDPADFRLAHKTSERAFYDTARRDAGSYEVIFETPDGHLTEGSFTSLFVVRDGSLVTPPLSRGLLPGILRQRLIDEGRAVEGDLTRADLAGGFFVGNALRGLIAARLVAGATKPGL